MMISLVASPPASYWMKARTSLKNNSRVAALLELPGPEEAPEELDTGGAEEPLKLAVIAQCGPEFALERNFRLLSGVVNINSCT